MGNIFKKVFGKGGVIDKGTRFLDKATGGITGKLLKGVESVVKSVPVVGGLYTAGKGLGSAMLNVADKSASKKQKEDKQVAQFLKTADKSPTIGIDYEVTVGNKKNWFGRIKDWFLALPMWLKVVIFAVPALLFVVFLFLKGKRPVRRRTTRRRAAAPVRRRTRKRSTSKSAFVKRMQAGKRRAAAKRRRK